MYVARIIETILDILAGCVSESDRTKYGRNEVGGYYVCA